MFRLELEEQMSTIEGGGHLCLFYDQDPAEQMPALVPFIREGLAKQEQFIYIADDQTVDELATQLERSGLNVRARCKSGHLKLYTRNEWRQPGKLDSTEKARQVRQFVSQAARAGFHGIRFAVEMTWTLGPDIDPPLLEHWEATINTLFEPSFPARIICQYNRNRLPPDALIAALHTHPKAILGRDVYPNPFFEAPFILNGGGLESETGHGNGKGNGHLSRARLNWMLAQLERVREGERHRTEAAALRAIINHSPDCIKLVAPDGTLLEINPSGCRMLGASQPGEIVGKKVYQLVAPEDRERFKAFHERVCAGQTESLSFSIIGLNRARHFVESKAVPLQDSRTDQVNHLAVTRDVTEQRELQEARRFLAAVVESSDDAIVTKDLNGIITSWNQGAERLFGYRAEEVVGKSVTILIPEDRPDEEPAILAKLRRGERIQHYETIRRRKDGTLLNISLTVSPVFGADGRIIGASKIARDITEKKQAEQALRESEERFRTLADNIVQLAWTATGLGFATWYNRRWYEYTGATFEQMRGRGWEQVHHPDHLERVRRKLEKSFSEGQEWEDTFPLRGKDGQYRWFLSRAVPIRDSAGKIKSWFGTNTDITELREMREALAEANQELDKRIQERTASLTEAVAQMEEFSYTVSHDLRAPVRAMRGYAQIALEEYGTRLDERGRDFLERIARGSSRMERLIHDVLTYTRLARCDIQLHRVSLQNLVHDILQEHPKMQPPHAEIVIRKPLHDVLAHEPLLTQAISNLLANGIKFVARGTTPKIQVWTEIRNGRIRLWVEDNGVGIKPQYQHRLFGMFERVHQDPHYDGMGIGLAIVRKAAARMGGSVGVESDGITGSSFWLELAPADAI